MARSSKKAPIQSWQKLGEKRIQYYLSAIQATSLKKKLPHLIIPHVELFLVTKKKIAELNGQFRKKHKPTDILSFPTSKPFHEIGQLGELVICIAVLKGQAKIYHHRPEDELDVLIVHGLLHLFGFDHELGEKESSRMARWEKKLLLREGSLIHRSKLDKVKPWKN